MRAITSPTIRRLAALLVLASLSGCGPVWNDPYPAAERGGNILYTAFSQRPKHLDPVQSYSEDEATFLYQIYEPPLQYHYLKRPFQLQVAAAQAVMGAVDENRLLAHQRFGTGVGQCIEQQRRIGCCCVCVMCNRAVKQFVAIYIPFFIDYCLTRNAGHIGLVLVCNGAGGR